MPSGGVTDNRTGRCAAAVFWDGLDLVLDVLEGLGEGWGSLGGLVNPALCFRGYSDAMYICVGYCNACAK